jgi:hypothetical protein
LEWKDTREEMVQPATLPNLIELPFWTPSDWIGNPVVDVRFMPAGAIDADLDLGWKGTLSNLAVDGGPGQPGSSQNGFQTDNALWFPHGRAASWWVFLTAADPDRPSITGKQEGFSTRRSAA